MTLFRLQFAGRITKAEHKTAGNKPLVEVSLCRKYKQGDEEFFTWVRVSIWEPAAFQTDKLHKGAFIAGSGDFKLRSYTKDGVKGTSAEVTCRSFDVEVSDGGDADIQPAGQRVAPAPQRPAAPTGGSLGIDDSNFPPFNRSDLEFLA